MSPVATNEVHIGQQLVRVETGSRTLIAIGGADPLFRITGGPIYLESLVGVVTSVAAITAGGTIITHLQLNAPVLAGGDICLAAGGLDIDTLALDSSITITGAVGAAAVACIIGIEEAPGFLTNHQILSIGDIELFTVDGGAGGDIAGSINWCLVFRPLGLGISVVVIPPA